MHPELYTMTMNYLDILLLPGEREKYPSVFLALNAQCEPHCDVNNVGLTVVTAIGDYSGGLEQAPARG